MRENPPVHLTSTDTLPQLTRWGHSTAVSSQRIELCIATYRWMLKPYKSRRVSLFINYNQCYLYFWHITPVFIPVPNLGTAYTDARPHVIM